VREFRVYLGKLKVKMKVEVELREIGEEICQTGLNLRWSSYVCESTEDGGSFESPFKAIKIEQI
jgi:hypothetical protein